MRLPDWETRLVDYINRVRRTPFNRAGFDCLRFTADAIYQVVGYDLAHSFRSYTTDEEARAITGREPDAFYNLVSLTMLEAGFAATDWKHAHRGDPCFIVNLSSCAPQWEGGLGICMGDHCLTPHGTGLIPIRMRAVRTAWNIPYV